MARLAERAKAAPAPEMMAANVKSGDHYMINVVRRTKPQGAIAHDVGTEDPFGHRRQRHARHRRHDRPAARTATAAAARFRTASRAASPRATW